jgi:very-short-patch-repair endonuclease
MDIYIAKTCNELDGYDIFEEAVRQREPIDRARVVLVWIDAPPDPYLFALTLYALGTDKPMVIATTNDVFLKHQYLQMAWHSAPFFSCVTLEDALLLTQKLVEHGATNLGGNPYGSEWAAKLRTCESPIEERLLIHILHQCGMDSDVSTQVDVTTHEGAKYRIDIALVMEPYEKFGGFKIAVECDGHDFHERTKEQARRDRSRDRALILEGWRVLRFTGSEIWKDAAACASQVSKLLKMEDDPE